MRPLTDREKRTIKIGGIGLAVYLALFSWRHLETRRVEYQKLVREMQTLEQEARNYEVKAEALKKRMIDLRLDPAQLDKQTLVAEASSAIQKAAAGGGVQLGPVREFSGQGAARELASMKMEGVGPVPAIFGFLHKLDTIGFPIIVDGVQINPDPTKPGFLKFTITFVIMDFEQWKKGTPNA